MAVGFLNPTDLSHATTTRPSATLTGSNQRLWWSDPLNTEVRDWDLNGIIAQIRSAADFYSIPDVEGDDTILRKAIQAGAGALSGNIAALQAVTPVVNGVPYFSSTAPSMSTFAASSYSRGLMGLTTITQWQSALGISASSNPNVIALAGLAGGANQLPYFTGTGTMSQTAFSAAARTLLDDADIPTMRSTLGLGTMAIANTADYMPLVGGQFSGAVSFMSPNFSLAIESGNPKITYDTSDYVLFNRSSNTLGFYIGGTLRASVTNTEISVSVPLALPADPASPLHAATKQYVDAAVTASGTDIPLTALVDIPNNRILGNVSGGVAPPASLTNVQVKTLLAITTADISDFASAIAGKANTTYVDSQDALKAPIASPALTGNPTAPTQISTDNSTKIATTAFVQAAMVGAGTVTQSYVDTADALRVLKAGDTMTGFLTLSAAPTSNLHAATKKYVDDAIVALGNLASLDLITNGQVSATAAIAWSKLATTGAILNADIAAGAAISWSKISSANSIVNADIASGAAIALSKLATIADDRILGNISGVAAVPTALSNTQVKSMLAIAVADVSGLGPLATQATVFNANIDANALIAISKLQTIANNRFLGNVSGAIGPITELTASQAKTLLNLATGDISGLGALATLSTITDAQVAAGAAIDWTKINSAGQIRNPDLAADASIQLSKLVAIPDQRIIGNVSGVTATPVNLTQAHVKTFLALTSADISGLGALATLNEISNAQVAAGANIAWSKVNSLGVIVNADISAAADIAWSKIATTGAIVNADISAGASIQLSKLVSIPNNRLLGNVSGAAATPVDLTAASVKTFLSLAAADISGLGALATLNTVGTAQIDAGAVVYSKIVDQAAGTILGRGAASGTGSPQSLSASQVKSILAYVAGDISGLGALATLNEIANAQVATGAAIAWSKIATAGAVTNADIAAAAGISFSKLQTLNDQRLLGNISGAVATPTALTAANVKVFLGLTTSDISGLGALATLSTIANAQVAAGAAIAWSKIDSVGQIVNADISNTAAIQYAKLVAIPDQRLLGNISGVSQTAAALTTAQVKTMLGMAVADISGLQAALDLKAPLASPAFTGNPTAPTQASGNNTTRVATTAFVAAATATLSIVRETNASAYTLQLADAGGWVAGTLDGPQTITIPAQSSVAWPDRTFIWIGKAGSNAITLSPEAGVTIESAGSGAFRLVGRGSACFLFRRASNIWVATGDLSV